MSKTMTHLISFLIRIYHIIFHYIYTGLCQGYIFYVFVLALLIFYISKKLHNGNIAYKSTVFLVTHLKLCTDILCLNVIQLK